MRVIRLLVAIACIAAGAAVGALNPQPLSVDLGFMTWHATLGVAILVALLTGAIAGGVMLAFSVVLPLRQKLRRNPPSRGMPAPPPAGSTQPQPPVDGI